MNIVLVGYGKMGKMIHKIAEGRGHSIQHIVNSKNKETVSKLSNYGQIDAVIEFTQPDDAIANFKTILSQNIPVVSGTTGWYDHTDELQQWVETHSHSFLYASNFSLGVNILWAVNKQLGPESHR